VHTVSIIKALMEAVHTSETSVYFSETILEVLELRFLIQSLVRAETHVDLHLKCQLFFKIGMCRQILVELPNIKLRGSSFGSFRVL
jgi:hypothetical protein